MKASLSIHKFLGLRYHLLLCLIVDCLQLGDLEARLKEDLEVTISSLFFVEASVFTATASVPAFRRLILERFAGKLSLRLN